ncbi:beta-lactamase family protein [Pelomonas sp. CA6]|uniref:serine hydrolase domain-containing protein n=1 Tax=Pelomonas sp. CA6 TaxID=2907999 RepID=UPI001F4BEB86|nr:beta-lactamase family protein [Pelomonas sp. CA6]MCH7343359.1 beta-lactamase family protein [Pelomonas sp. CA6]
MSETNASTDLRGALDALFADVNRSDAPGLVVGVAHQGRALYRRGFGLASLEHGVTNTVWTRMRIGSTSKHFTCLAALLLAEEGRLDIDASVRRYLPELPALQGEPSLRQLMQHTGGYRCYLDVGFLADGETAIKPKGEALSSQMRQSCVNFAPGEKMMYCNGGYHLLSHIIERVSGQPFRQFLRERIFLPLGMRDTAQVPSDFEIHRGMATLHDPVPKEQGGGWRRGIFPTEDLGGEGAIISTIDDMLTWLAHLRGPKTVGSEASWRQMLTPARLNNGTEIPYALGLMVHPYRGVGVVHHAGGVIGGACQMITVPSHELDIIIMSNGALVSPTALAFQVIDTVLADALPAERAAKPDSEPFKPMLGTRYHAPGSGLVIGFDEAAEGKLGLRILNNPPLPLTENGSVLQFGVEDIAAGPLCVSTAALAREGEPPSALDISEGGHVERFERLPANPPSAEEASHGLLGRYRAPDLEAQAELRLDEGQLRLEVIGAYGRHTMALEPFSTDVFGWREKSTLPLFGVLNLERDADRRVQALRIDTVRTRGLRFERLPD